MTELTFAEKLKRLYNKLDNLSHRQNSDTSYYLARDIASELQNLMPQSNNIRLDVKILNSYSYKACDKRKSEVIEEFRKETMFDLLPIVKRGDKTPDTTSE